MIQLNQGEALKKIRESRHMTQNKVATLAKISKSSYSRIESDHQVAKTQELDKILRVLHNDETDLANKIHSDTQYTHYFNKYLNLYKKFDLKTLKEVYNFFRENKETSMYHYFAYVKIKRNFSDNYSEIVPTLSKVELIEIYNRIKISTEYSVIDYQLVADFLKEFSPNKAKELLDKLLPVNLIEASNRGKNYRTAVTQLLNNAIDQSLAFNQITQAEKYLKLLIEFTNDYPHAQYKILIPYYLNLINYLKKPNLKNIEKVVQIIKAMETLNLNEAEGARAELESYINKTKQPGAQHVMHVE